MSNAETIAAGLTKAQRSFVLAASIRPKKWAVIKRHAKIDPRNRMRPIQNFYGILLQEREYPWRYFLTPLGLEVRAILEKSNG